MNVVILGAGQTGRGFLGRLAFLSGANITYVDKNENIVEALSDRGDYQIDFFGRQRQALCIRGYEALHLQHPAAAKRVAEADLVMTSVLAENLAGIVPLLERALFLRGLLPPILVCENGIRPSAKLRDALPKSVRISDAVLLCTTCAHGLDISSQDLDFLPYDAAGFDIPAGLYGFSPEYDYPLLCRRKTYTYNCMSACICYLGAEKGYVRFEDAANDPQIHASLLELRQILDRVIAREYGIDLAEQSAFSQTALDKFASRDIEDTVARNARGAMRKLGPAERIVAPMLLAKKQGEDIRLFEHILAAAIRYGVKESTINTDIGSRTAVCGLLQKVCGIEDVQIQKEIANILLMGGKKDETQLS